MKVKKSVLFIVTIAIMLILNSTKVYAITGGIVPIRIMKLSVHIILIK